MTKKQALTENGAKSTHPVQVLRDYAVALEAAMAETLTRPKKSAVHKLRSTTRRLEAQMELLHALHSMEEHSEEAARVHKRLDRLRKLAGRVRDVDVQKEMLQRYRSLPRGAAAELTETLDAAREKRAAKLQRVLRKQLPRVTEALATMMQSVGTAHGMVLPDVRLLPLIERWKKTHEAATPPERMTDDELHGVRKTAKSARYMAESGAGTRAAARVAEQYEEEQDAGGRWHDWLELAATARAHFGKKHALTVAAVEHCRTARAEYVRMLAE